MINGEKRKKLKVDSSSIFILDKRKPQDSEKTLILRNKYLFDK